MVGILQEQHPGRARLFMQWKQMDWPLLVDPLNLLGVSVVPVTVLLDEYGIVRAINPKQDEFQQFMEEVYPEPKHMDAPRTGRSDLAALEQAALGHDPDALRNYADALFLWSDEAHLDEAIEGYTQALQKDPEHGPTHYRLGVAFRRRYESPFRRANDFNHAAQHWGQALDIDPNQYIWRRRIQQYGPRLDKPYSFYDWVIQAREEIEARGETPVPLTVEPGGAELAYPAQTFDPAPTATRPEPDPGGRIIRDEQGLIQIEATVVPATLQPGGSGRVHVVLRPDQSQKAHWNNEVDDLVFWVDPPAGWEVDTHYLTVGRPPEAVSQEVRKVEFELKIPDELTGPVTIPAYVLYYVCEDVDGTCLYRRQDVSLRINVAGGRK